MTLRVVMVFEFAEYHSVSPDVIGEMYEAAAKVPSQMPSAGGALPELVEYRVERPRR